MKNVVFDSPYQDEADMVAIGKKFFRGVSVPLSDEKAAIALTNSHMRLEEEAQTPHQRFLDRIEAETHVVKLDVAKFFADRAVRIAAEEAELTKLRAAKTAITASVDETVAAAPASAAAVAAAAPAPVAADRSTSAAAPDTEKK
jgi:hypothetical protein